MRLSAVRLTGLVLGLATLSACAGGGARSGQELPPNATIAASMTLERFLAAANQKDLDTMASLFGTRDGSVRSVWSREEVDRRMLLLANVLTHTDYTIAGEQIVAGRRDEATQLNVRMVISGDTVVVPFTLVRIGPQSWLVENVNIEAVTRGPANRGSGL